MIYVLKMQIEFVWFNLFRFYIGTYSIYINITRLLVIVDWLIGLMASCVGKHGWLQYDWQRRLIGKVDIFFF